MDHKVARCEGQNRNYTYYCTCGWKTAAGLSHLEGSRAIEAHAKEEESK